MTPADLRKLIKAATPGPWLGVMFHSAGDMRLVKALTDLAPELLALWEAINKVDAGEADDDAIWDAHDALNRKAETL